MSDSTRQTIDEALAAIRLIDPHTHINPHAPAAATLADLLGYHYYTELAHSAGMPRADIEAAGIGPRELVGRLVANLGPLENTAQYSWLIEICRQFFGFDGERLDASNWEQVYDAAEQRMGLADWPQRVLDQSHVESVFLTNDFDDELSGFDADVYIPCLRTDDLVFHLGQSRIRQRLAACTGMELDGSLESLRRSLRQRFEHFVAGGARACAISLPPSFAPKPVSDGRAANALDQVLTRGAAADPAHLTALSRHVFWTLAELCDEFGLPFDLMIGVNRGVYTAGVHQGQDLYDSRVSLIQYRELFNAFPAVTFPISVLASVTNQELVSYAWIFPNVITNGHWWYSNTPSFIARDAAARLEAVPQNKQIGYYSDAYKLEFIGPKFAMYRRILSRILADHFVGECGWSETRAIELGTRVLRGNVEQIFPRVGGTGLTHRETDGDTWVEQDEQDPAQESQETTWEARPEITAATSSALAAGAIGMVEVEPAVPGEPAPGDDEPQYLDSLPTTVDSPGNVETVKMDDEPQDELDPAPSDEEIEAVGLDDVELLPEDLATAADPHTLDAPADDELLDVGELWGEEPQSADQAGIEPLRGEESFVPDDDDLQLSPDPATGEWTLPVAAVDETAERPPVDQSDQESGKDDLLATIDLDEDENGATSDDELVDFELLDDPDDPEEQS